MEQDFETIVPLRSRVRVSRALRRAPLVIALHGWGMSERSFERWLRPGIDHRETSWWIPRGLLPCEIRGARRRVGYAWYVFDGDQAALRASMDEARAYLAGLVALARRQLEPRSLSLLGFSQGAYLASYVALSRPDLFDALVCCCGRPKAEFVDDLEAAKGVRVLVQMGRDDAAVSPELIAKGVGPLRAAGLDVAERTYETAHKMAPDMATDAAEFVA